jgi:multiple sugar transport system substrate-binding protein
MTSDGHLDMTSHEVAGAFRIEKRARVSRRGWLRIAGGGIAGLGVAAVLSACNGGVPTAQPAPAEPAEPTAETAEPIATAGTVAPAAPAEAVQAGPGGFSGGGSLKILVNAHFVPAYDAWLDDWAAAWGKKNNVTIEVDHLLTADFPARVAAEVASGAGHDVIRLPRSGDANLYDKYLVDVGDIAKPIGEANGGWAQPVVESLAVVDGVWKVLPDFFTSFDGHYRKDLFDAAGLQAPDTWDQLLKAGTILKTKGNQIGISINQQSTDSLSSWSSLFWSYGASTVAADSKTITINSPESRQALEYAVELFNKAMTPAVLSWDEAANNQLLASGKGAWIHNPISALRTIEKQTPDLAEKIWLTPTPAGPKGRFTTGTSNNYGIMSWTQNASAAKAFFVDYFNDFGAAFKASEGYNQPYLLKWRQKPMPILGDSPKYSVDQDAVDHYRATGWPGKPTQAAGEVEANWILPLMVARAVQDNNLNGAIEWAEQKIQAIYDKYR